MDASANRVGAATIGLVLAAYLFSAGGSLTTTDAVVAFEVTRQLVDHQSLALPRNMLGNEAHRGVDGRYYSPFGITQSIFNVPFFVAGRLAARVTGLSLGRADAIEKATVALGNTVAMAACLWVFFVFAHRLAGSTRVAAVITLAAAFATPLWPYSKFGFNAPLAALLVSAACLCAWNVTRSDRRTNPAWIGWWLGLALLTRHELPVLILPIAAWLYLESASVALFNRRMTTLAAGFVPALVVWLGYNAYRFGNPLDAGYLRDPIPQFGSSMLTGIYGLLLSPTASLVVYCPLVIFAVASLVVLARHDRPAAVLFGGSAIAVLLFYAQLGNWMGGRSYGPRYLVPILPLLMLPLAAMHKTWRPSTRVVVLALTLVSVAVQLAGVIVDYAKVSVAHARTYGAPTADDQLFNWRVSPLVLNTRAAAVVVPHNLAWLTGGADRPASVRAAAPDQLQADFSQQFADTLDFWWMYLFRMGVVSRRAVWVLVACMIGTMAALGYRLRGLLAAA
jgi:hypothetical protein